MLAAIGSRADARREHNERRTPRVGAGPSIRSSSSRAALVERTGASSRRDAFR
jgi:hypothetical protein